MIANLIEENEESKKRGLDCPSTDVRIKFREGRVEHESSDEEDEEEEKSSERCGCEPYDRGIFNWDEVTKFASNGILSTKSSLKVDSMADFFWCLHDQDTTTERFKEATAALFVDPRFEETVYRSSKQTSRHYDIPSFVILIQHPVFLSMDIEAYCRGMCQFDEYEPDRDLVSTGLGFEKVDCERAARQVFHSVAALFCDFKVKEAEVKGADKVTKRNWLIELQSHIIVAKEYAWIRPGRKAVCYWTSLFDIVNEVSVARSEELKSLEYDESDLHGVENIDECYFEKIMNAKGM